MHVVPIPPPCVIAFWRVLLGGGRGGAKANYRPGAVAGAEANIVGELGAGSDRGWQRSERHRQFVLAPSRCASTHLGLRGSALGVALHRLTQAVRHGRATRWANRPCGDGRTRHGGAVRLHGDTGQATAGGCDYRPDPRLTTAVAGGWRNWLYARLGRRSGSCTASTWTTSPQQACGTRAGLWTRLPVWAIPYLWRVFWKFTPRHAHAWCTSGTHASTRATCITEGHTTTSGNPGNAYTSPSHPGGGVNGPAETAHGAGQCAHALHRENPVVAQLGHVGASTTTPRAHHQCQWGDAGNGIGTVEGRDSRGPGTDLPRRREHGQPNPRHLRLRGPATHLQHGCRSAFDADTHTPALTPTGGERCGA